MKQTLALFFAAVLAVGALVAQTDGFDLPLKPESDYGVTLGANDFLTRDDESYSCGTVYHPGQDLNALDGRDEFGDPVYVAGDGVIKFAGQAGSCWGNVVLIEHDGEFVLPEGGVVTDPDTQYGHMASIGENPRTNQPWEENDAVFRGEKIGTVGDGNGCVTPHLHFEVRKSESLDSAKYFPCGETKTTVHRFYTHPTNFVNLNRPPAGELTPDKLIAIDTIEDRVVALEPFSSAVVTLSPLDRENLVGLAFSRCTGDWFTTDQGEKELLRLDIRTGLTTLIGTYNTVGGFSALTFGPNCLLWGALSAPGGKTLIAELDITTAAVTPLTGEFSSLLDGLAYNPDDGNLYGVHATGFSRLYRIDLSTGTVTFLGSSGSGAVKIAPSHLDEHLLVAKHNSFRDSTELGRLLLPGLAFADLRRIGPLRMVSGMDLGIIP